MKATVVYCDNISTMYLSTNLVQHQRTKHIKIDLHFVQDRDVLREARVLHVPTCLQYADIFTKGLPSAVFQEFRSQPERSSRPCFDPGGEGVVCYMSYNYSLVFRHDRVTHISCGCAHL
jgi:hypothetical protein